MGERSQGSTLARFASSQGERTESFVYEGTEFEFRATPTGDDYFAVLYPDPLEANNAASTYGTANHRGRAYPIEIYGDVLAIEKAYVPPAGEERPDRAVIYSLYDANPGLFGAMRSAALTVLNVAGVRGENSGLYNWQAVYLSVRSMIYEIRGEKNEAKILELAKSIYSASMNAIRDYRRADDLPAFEDLADSEKEGILENLGN